MVAFPFENIYPQSTTNVGLTTSPAAGSSQPLLDRPMGKGDTISEGISIPRSNLKRDLL